MKPIIGIPVHNDLEAFREMMYSLLHSTKHFDKIILLESGSTDGTAEECDIFATYNENIEVIHTKKEGPLKAMNQLFDIAIKEQKDIFFTQTDVLFPKLYKRDWLEQMSKLAENPLSGMITCLNGGSVSGDSYLNGFYWIGGWCMYVPIHAINKVGKYDEEYPNGWGVDVDYTYAMAKNGLQNIQINYWVDHHMQNNRSHDDDEEGKQAAAKRFKKKWTLP